MRHVQRCRDDVGGEQADRKAKLAVGEVVAVGWGAVVIVEWRRRCTDTVVVGWLERRIDTMVVIAAFVECVRRGGGVPIVARGMAAQRMHAPVDGAHQDERQERGEREDGAGAQHRVMQCRHDGAHCKSLSAGWH